LNMSFAYADNYTLLKSETAYFKHLHQKYWDRILNFFEHTEKRLVNLEDIFNK
jgi:hypothetical protein